MFSSNSAWIDLRGQQNNVVLQVGERPLATLRHACLQYPPNSRCPQLIMCIGERIKTSAVNSLFSMDDISTHRKVHLRHIPTASMFVADCELHNLVQVKKALNKPRAGVIHEHYIDWLRHLNGGLEIHRIAHLLYTEVLAPFSNVICLFADDLDGLRGTSEIIASWLTSTQGKVPRLPKSTFPVVLILKRWTDSNAPFDEKLATEGFLDTLRQVIALGQGTNLGEDDLKLLIRQRFSDIRLLPLPNNPSSRRPKCVRAIRMLHERIIHESKDVQRKRRDECVELSAPHYISLFHATCEKFASDLFSPPCYINAARRHNPLPEDMEIHLGALAKAVRKTTPSFMHRIIASSLCLDSYPPDMHFFHPKPVFQNLYYKLVQNSFAGSVEDIEEQFCQQALRNHMDECDTKLSHRQVLSEFSHWDKIYSDSTCFGCGARPPENKLTCRHSLCDPCVIMHAVVAPEAPWAFSPPHCPLCRRVNEKIFNLKPYTAGVRALVIDGGATYDIRTLSCLERMLNLPMHMHENFDFSVASGQGSILKMELFCKEWSLKECLTQSEKLKQSQRREELANVQKSRFSQYSIGLVSEYHTRLKDMKLPGGSMLENKIMREVLGVGQLFDFGGNGTKLATAVCTAEQATSLFTNYNGKGKSMYALIKPRPKDVFQLWQIGRAATCDPSETFHGYQMEVSDDNSKLLQLALDEQDRIWSRENKSPDIVVCLGTNVDIHSMQAAWLSDHRIQQDPERVLKKSVDGLLASLFYVQLLRLPELCENDFRWQAKILCRLSPSHPALIQLVKRLRNARFHYDYRTETCVTPEIEKAVSRGIEFSRMIEFRTRSLADVIDIKILGVVQESRSISNCPYKLHSLIHDQGLDCVFGHRDHQRRV